MKNRYDITSSQFFIMLSISQLFSFFALSTLKYDLSKPLSFIIALGIGLVFALLSFLFVSIDFKKAENLLNKKVKMTLKIFLTVIFGFIALQSLISFSYFMKLSVNPDSSVWFISILILALCAYCAYKGFEGLSRANVIFLIFIIIAFVFLFVSTAQSIRFQNIKDIFIKSDFDFNSVYKFTVFFVTNLFFVPLISVFKNNVKGNKKCAASVSFLLLSALYLSVFLLLVGVFSSFITNTDYPFYTLSESGVIGVFNNMEVLMLLILTISCFVKVTLMFVSINKVVNIKSKKLGFWGILIAVSVVLVLSQIIKPLEKLLLNDYILAAVVILSVLISPFCFVKERSL